MGLEERIGDWRTAPPIVTRPERPDPDTISLNGLDDEEREIILDARARKACRLAREEIRRATDAANEVPSQAGAA